MDVTELAKAAGVKFVCPIVTPPHPHIPTPPRAGVQGSGQPLCVICGGWEARREGTLAGRHIARGFPLSPKRHLHLRVTAGSAYRGLK